MGPIDYEKIFVTQRFNDEKTNITIDTAFSSDKSRVIFSSSFRRLQQKAQVFSLEKNPAVRSRLTHTLEVSNTGSIIAKKVAQKLIERGHLDESLRVPFIDITETCCLLHDIGNPPFGHFGEAAIQRWFRGNWQTVFKAAALGLEDDGLLADHLINDFLYFDGNPQGVRMSLYLQDLPDTYQGIGLNLTFSQILAFVKYNGDSDEARAGRLKKPGYFHSEGSKIAEVKNFLGWSTRYPITYLMEAADDISYCMSDIEDGIEKDIITADHFFRELFALWKVQDLGAFGYDIKTTDLHSRYHFFRFKVHLTRSLIDRVSSLYVDNEEQIATGQVGDLLDLDPDSKDALVALKTYSRKHLFRAPEAEEIELAGYKVIFGLLECFRPLLELPFTKFSLLVHAIDDVKLLLGKGLDVEWRLFNRLANKQLAAYRYAIREQSAADPENFVVKEWFYRSHLIVDYIAGMTDNFALESYRHLNGIEF